MSDEHDRTELEAERAARLRLAADFANFRRRIEAEALTSGAAALDDFVARLLPLSDFIDLAIGALPDELRTSGHGEGLRGLRRELDAALASVDVERLDPHGLPFDPTLHEAAGVEPLDGVAPGAISRVLRPGFRRDERLLRPALVAVAPETPPPGPPATTDREAVERAPTGEKE
jgi:molecular chaperone GrpE